MNPEEICEQVHNHLDSLKKMREKPKNDIPLNGIYFWYEEGEVRKGGMERITRVGTHEKPNRLRGRIMEHYGLNRAGSSFRKHLGGALLGKNEEVESEIKEWYKGRRSQRFHDKKFQNYENSVTAQANLGSYRLLRVDDPNERSLLEEKLISLFSQCKHCLPSNNWLGKYAYRKKIRQSGLWNVGCVGSSTIFTQNDLPILKKLTDFTLNKLK